MFLRFIATMTVYGILKTKDKMETLCEKMEKAVKDELSKKKEKT